MKLTIFTVAGLLMAATPTLAAQSSCDKIKADIEQKIINNGVPESGFSLTIVPNDQADKPDAQVVGHCGNDTQKILYRRTASGNNESEMGSSSQVSDS